MSSYNETKRSLKSAASRTIVLALLTAAFLIACVLMTGTLKTFAADDSTLTVKKDGEVVRVFSMEELQQIAADEGNKSYTFSAWNTYPTFNEKKNINGPTIDGILEEAGIRGDVTDTGTVIFSDGAYKVSLTGMQLFGETRYYYPKGGLVDQINGVIPEAAYQNAVEVEAVLYLSGGEDENVLYFGQVAPNEENLPAFVKYVSSIEVSTATAPKCPSVEPDPADGSDCLPGQEIVLNKRPGSTEYIYYTMQPGEVPDYGSVIYNSGSKQGLETRPVLPDTYGPVTLSVVVKGYGKLDSDVQVINYNVPEPLPSAPYGVSASVWSFDTVYVSWGAQADISGFRIYRSVGGGPMSLYMNVGSGTTSIAEAGLQTGVLYSYMITAIKPGVDGSILESAASATVSAIPAPAAPQLKLKAGKRKATVKWNRVAGADGYVIYRSTKPTSGFKIVKTIKKGTTKSFTNKKLKKKKKYYYRICAYRKVGGTKVYGAYSDIGMIKAK